MTSPASRGGWTKDPSDTDCFDMLMEKYVAGEARISVLEIALRKLIEDACTLTQRARVTPEFSYAIEQARLALARVGG